MKKVIPQKIVNIVYEKLLAGKRLEVCSIWSWDRSIDDWVWHDNYWEDIFYKPNTNEISNKFFKNKVSKFIYNDRDNYWLRGRLLYTRKQMDKLKDDLNDYIQEQ